ncbi:MAG: aconitase family protein, partial [Candidatus Kariarchaeaceae archaeon]
MAYTMIQKIIGSHSDEEPIPGSIVWMDLDVRSARDFAGASVVKNLESNYEGEPQIADLTKTVFTFDCVVPANNLGYAENQQIIRDYARERDIKLYDVNAGIGSHILIDEGLAVPNSTVVGTDSHLNILGAIGSFGQGMGDQDIAFTFKAGRTWFEVPETMKVTIEGEMPDYCTPKDLTLAVVKRFGAKGALGKAVEFEGKAIDKLSLDGRITLASMVTEMGGIIGLIEPNDEVMEYCRAQSNT